MGDLLFTRRNEANKDTRPLRERKFAGTRKHKSGQAPFRAWLSARRRALLLRLVGHGIVSEKNGAAQVQPEARGAPRFVVEGGRCDPLTSPRSLQSCARTVKFKLLIATIRGARIIASCASVRHSR